MRQDSINSNIIYNNTETFGSTPASSKILPNRSTSIGTKEYANERTADTDFAIERVKLSLFEKMLIFLCCGAVVVGLFVILQGRIQTTNISYQIDNINSRIQTTNQENQDLNSEVQVLTNSSRLEKLAQEYGLQLDESRVQNVLK